MDEKNTSEVKSWVWYDQDEIVSVPGYAGMMLVIAGHFLENPPKFVKYLRKKSFSKNQSWTLIIY